MSDITVSVTAGGVTVVTDTLGAATAAAAAAVSAAAASSSASAASASAANALTSENNAETAEANAEAALNDALAIYGSIAAVQAAASAAAASAAAASASELAAETAEANAETAETNAETAQTAAAASAVSASASATTATNQAAAAASSALSAASVVSQDLSAIDRTVFAATIVDTFLYDTSKDSDGGAWRKRCAHTSWENETLSGNWLGSAANEAAARAISGATTGSYYYDTTAAGFYTLNAGSGKTATYRGNVRQFPAQVLITLEGNRLVLWDLTQAGVPMWMVFIGVDGGIIHNTASNYSVTALNGIVTVGAARGVTLIKFISDRVTRHADNTNYSRTPASGMSTRTTLVILSNGDITATIVNSAVNDVAMTVLPNAPVDVATGLPIPVIDVFTDAGTSRINTDGTVADLADTAGDDHKAGCILASGDSVALNSTNGNVDIYKLSNTLADTLTPDRTYDQATVPALLEAVDAGDKVVAMKHRLAIGQDNGVNVLLENPASVAAGMIAYITKDVPPMWQVGAIKGAWLADTVAETVTGTELVTNGTFDTDTSGWTASNLTGSVATLSAVSGRLRVTNNAAGGRGAAYQSITTVVGKTYVVNVTGYNGTSSLIQARIGTTVGGYEYAAVTLSDGVSQMVSFVATSTTLIVMLDEVNGTASQYVEFDNISCRLADVDRSVKAKGLQAFGSLTKAAVASGAALMGYSGFSAANYLEQPYNSDLDFGTGDFCVMGWAKTNSTADYEGLFNRYSASGHSIIVRKDVTTGYPTLRLVDGSANAANVTGASSIATNTPVFIVAGKSGTTGYLYVNGVLAASGSVAAVGTLTDTDATTRLGGYVGGSYPANYSTLALWRASATFPTAEQIKHIYETERPMFEANAQCCLAGTSNAVTALAYDEETDLLHVGTSYGRSAFKGLVRVSSEATPVGAITALAAGAGVVVQGGATAVDVYVPAYTLREELLRDAEQMAKFGQNLIAHDFTATASQEVFTLPVGWEIVAVYQQGTLKRETTAWVKTFDGFKWSVDLVTGATVSDWISILAKRV